MTKTPMNIPPVSPARPGKCILGVVTDGGLLVGLVEPHNQTVTIHNLPLTYKLS